MPVNQKAYQDLISEIRPRNVTLVAVSKTKTIADIKDLYDLGQRDFAENYVQELLEKKSRLPSDIRWHFIGHLQSNKIKQLVPFVQLIQGVDSLKLLEEINKQGKKIDRVIDCLLQVHIAQEETKFGLDENEVEEIFSKESESFTHKRIRGLMGMASFTTDMDKVRSEFRYLKKLFNKNAPLATRHSPLTVLSMGMTADYKIALEEGSNMIRIGSLLFGERTPE